MNSPRVLKSLSELLMTIPEMLGYTPAESLVLLPLNGMQSAALIRVDLPADADEERIGEYCATMLDHLLRLSDVTGFYAVTYTEQPLEHELPPHTFTIARLAELAAHGGIRLVGAACVTAQGWTEYWGNGSGTLAEIRSDLAALVADDVSELTQLVPASEVARARVAALLQHPEHTVPTDDEVLCAWNLYVDGANWLDPVYEPILIALVAAGLQRPRTLELLVACGAFGIDTAEHVAEAWHDLSGHMSDAELVGITEVFADEVPADLARAERATAALRSIASHLEPELARHAFAALAWLHGCCGRASIATEYARQSLRNGHQHLAARVLERMEDGYVPGWIYRASCLAPVRDTELVGGLEREHEW